jgi:hypothetical protein
MRHNVGPEVFDDLSITPRALHLYGLIAANANLLAIPSPLINPRHCTNRGGNDKAPKSTQLTAKRAPTEADAKNDPTEVVLAALASHPSLALPCLFINNLSE